MLRHIINFGLLFCFGTLFVSGVISFIEPFSIAITRIHIVFGFVTMVLVGVHLYHRRQYFKQQFKFKSDAGVSKLLLTGIVLLWGILLSVSLYNWRPAQLLIEQGYEAKHRKEIIRPNPLVASKFTSGRVQLGRKKKDGDTVVLNLDLALEKDVSKETAMAIWAETRAGTMIETLYISSNLAYSDKPKWNGRETPRYKILPVWRHRYTTVTGIDPQGKVDAASGATEEHNFSLEEYLKPEAKDYIIFIEINAPADPDSNWLDKHIGQPSVLYSAYIDHRNPKKHVLLELTGHGGDADQSGSIHYELEKLSTAKSLLDIAIVTSKKI